MNQDSVEPGQKMPVPSKQVNGQTGLRLQNGSPIVTSIPTLPVTVERQAYVPDADSPLVEAGAPRANIAADSKHPKGTTEKNWAAEHRAEGVLQQHCDFFDEDRDGVIWPGDTYRGFRRLGYNVAIAVYAMIVSLEPLVFLSIMSLE